MSNRGLNTIVINEKIKYVSLLGLSVWICKETFVFTVYIKTVSSVGTIRICAYVIIGTFRFGRTLCQNCFTLIILEKYSIDIVINRAAIESNYKDLGLKKKISFVDHYRG